MVCLCIYVTEEVEELSGRLKASRQRVAELEKSFTSASSLNQKNEKVSVAPRTATLSCHICNDLFHKEKKQSTKQNS